MKVLTCLAVIAALFALTIRASAAEVQPPSEFILEQAIPTKPIGPTYTPQPSDKVRKFDARRQAVAALSNEFDGDAFAEAETFRREQEKVAKSADPEPLIVLGIATVQSRPQELDKFLTTLLTTRETALDVRIESAKMASFYGLPAALRAAQAAIKGDADSASYGVPAAPQNKAAATAAAAEKDRVRFFLLRAVARGNPDGQLDFIQKVADGDVTKSAFLIDYAKEMLANLKQARKVDRGTPVILCNTLAKAVRKSDIKTIALLNTKPTMQAPTVKNATIADSPQTRVMKGFLADFASDPNNWITLYDSAGCWNVNFEMILRQECGLWYVELGLPNVWLN